MKESSNRPDRQQIETDVPAIHQELITIQEAATILRVSRSTVWRWCNSGTLHSAFKIGRNWRIHRAELDEIIGRHNHETQGPSVAPDSPVCLIPSKQTGSTVNLVGRQQSSTESWRETETSNNPINRQ